jgi:carbonic anhydrase/acetyltransferase-like protein (isoleucine patch superfamily)
MSCGCDDQQWQRMMRRQILTAEAVANGELPSIPEGHLLLTSPPLAALPNGSFVSPRVEMYGDVSIGARCFVASNTIFAASQLQRISLGDVTNCQDNAYLLADAAHLQVGNHVSIAHQAVIENSVVGDYTFFGFRSRVRNSVIGPGCMVMHSTTVEGVTLPPGRITPAGATITSQEVADALPKLAEPLEEFRSEVLSVNEEFAGAYSRFYHEAGPGSLVGVGPNPPTSFNPRPVQPTLGDGVRLAEMVRIVGDVRLGDRSRVNQRTALRADEGTPIIIGRNARIGGRVTFHALLGTSVTVGNSAWIGDECVLHGPLQVGHNLVCEAGAVLFRAQVEDNVTIRSGATVIGDILLREGTIVPEGAVIETQAQADALPTR